MALDNDPKVPVRQYPYAAIPVTVITQADIDRTAAMARAMTVPTEPTEWDEAIAWMEKRWGKSDPAPPPIVTQEGTR